jgi:hypothetical protein
VELQYELQGLDWWQRLVVIFETKVLGKTGFEILQARKDSSLHPVPAWKGSILRIIDP